MARRNKVTMQVLKPQLLLIKDLKPHEEYNDAYHKILLEDVVIDHSINTPILVDKQTKVILDGHHRFSVAKKLKLAKIPCLMIDYLDDAVISVFSRKQNLIVDKKL